MLIHCNIIEWVGLYQEHHYSDRNLQQHQFLNITCMENCCIKSGYFLEFPRYK